VGRGRQGADRARDVLAVDRTVHREPARDPLPAVWDRGKPHIWAGEREQKTVNLGNNPHCVLITVTPDLHSGLDVVVEGVAERITEPDRLAELAALWKSRLDWDFQLREGGFDDGASHNSIVFAVAPARCCRSARTPTAGPGTRSEQGRTSRRCDLRRKVGKY
jgi:hypothetical protein